jgi:hypothetical protein
MDVLASGGRAGSCMTGGGRRREVCSINGQVD